MKKVLLPLLILIIITLVLFFIPIQHTETIPVKGDYSTLAQQINFPSNWEKWNFRQVTKTNAGNRENNSQQKYPKIFHLENGEADFSVEITNPLTFTISKQSKRKTEEVYSFHIVPTVKEDSFHLIVEHQQNIFHYLKDDSEKTDGYLLANQMKNYMENPHNFYGYPIEMTTAKDLNVITIKDTIRTVKKQERLKEMYDQLQGYIKQNQLKQVQKRIAYFQKYKSDSLIIMTGIAIDRLPPSAGDIEAVQMPENRILMSKYKGPYYKISAAYDALEKYVEDHKYQKIALPFERYLNDSIPPSDSAEVAIDIYYPIR